MKTFFALLITLLLGTRAMTQEKTAPVLETVSFGAGCFWCVEPFYEKLKGIQSAISGYQGGTTPNPTYEEVTSGRTGHAEVVKVTYDPAVISFEDLLDVFFDLHDPTTLNRQGADVGTQYRSILLVPTEAHAKAAKDYIAKLTADKVFAKPIVTQVEIAREFYLAENYHQDYFRRNPNAPYCRLVIAPKLKKVEIRPELLK